MVLDPVVRPERLVVSVQALALRIRESFWFLPAVFGLGAIVLAEVLVAVDRVVIDHGIQIAVLDALSASGGRSILTTIGTAMLTVAGTSFSITISVLATTSSTYGPRLVRNFMADRANQLVLAVFTSTFVYAVVVLRSVHTDVDDGSAFVPVIAVHVAVLIGLVDVAILVFFIHHIASSVQITSLQKRVQVELAAALDEAFATDDDDRVSTAPRSSGSALGTAVRAREDGYVQSVAWRRIVRWAVDQDAVVDVRAMPGQHVLPGDPVLVVTTLSGGPVDLDDRAVRQLRSCVTTGIARTPYQDVRFALQQLVEIAVRGLASGTNDPYTAVGALELAAAALVPSWRDRATVTACVDDDGVARVLPHWPEIEDLVGTVFDGVATYGQEHPLVLTAAVDLARRLQDDAPQARRVVAAQFEDRVRALLR